MVGRKKKSIRDYAIPAVLGAAAGVTGIAVAATRDKEEKEHLEDDEDEDEEEDYFKEEEKA